MSERRGRALVVVSSYAPAMIADMHRARQLAWELPSLGWDIEILTPDASYQQPSCLDDDSSEFFAPATPVHLVARHQAWLFRSLGLGSIGWRALLPMRQRGSRLLADGRFDVVYISTTQFPLFLLGPNWRRRRGVPFVLDLHDPCYRDDAAPPVWAKRAFKHEASRRIAGLIESRSVSTASGLVAVSDEYVAALRGRYPGARAPCLSPARAATIPFAVLPRDLEEAARGLGSRGSLSDDRMRLVYVGAGGPIMERSFGLFCKTLGRLRQSEGSMVERVRIELYGTMLGWREGERRHLAEVARDHGVGDLVHEDPRRVSYRRSLELLLGAAGALILGVDDTGYMPSKLFTYAYSGKPLCAAVRRDGPAHTRMRGAAPFGNVLWFDSATEIACEDGIAELRSFLRAAAAREVSAVRESLEPHLARTMARRHGELFEAVRDRGNKG